MLSARLHDVFMTISWKLKNENCRSLPTPGSSKGGCQRIQVRETRVVLMVRITMTVMTTVNTIIVTIVACKSGGRCRLTVSSHVQSGIEGFAYAYVMYACPYIYIYIYRYRYRYRYKTHTHVYHTDIQPPTLIPKTYTLHLKPRASCRQKP